MNREKIIQHFGEEIVKKAIEARELGATEVCIQGGIAPNLDISFYKNMILEIKKYNRLISAGYRVPNYLIEQQKL